MGFVFQAFNLIPVLSVAENVELPLLLAGTDDAEARWRRSRRSREWAWAPNRSPSPGAFGGEQQRVTLSLSVVRPLDDDDQGLGGWWPCEPIRD